MSASSRKLAKDLDRKEEKRAARENPMTTIGKEEVMITWEDEARGQFVPILPGQMIPTFMYRAAKEAGRVIRIGDTFNFKKVGDHGHEMACWITCVEGGDGYARYSYDDAGQKYRRERRQTRDSEVTELKLRGLNEVAIKAMEESAGVGNMLTAVLWVEESLADDDGVARNVLLMIFKSFGPIKLPEDQMKAVLHFSGFEPPEETGRSFTSVMYGVKTLLTQLSFGKKVADPNTNGHASVEDLHEAMSNGALLDADVEETVAEATEEVAEATA